MTRYAKLVEANEYEGETWMFYFPEDDAVINAINVLSGYSESIEMYGVGYTEEQVDFIIAETIILGGYKALASKVTISEAKRAELLALYEESQNPVESEDDEERFYQAVDDLFNKGGLFD